SQCFRNASSCSLVVSFLEFHHRVKNHIISVFSGGYAVVAVTHSDAVHQFRYGSFSGFYSLGSFSRNQRRTLNGFRDVACFSNPYTRYSNPLSLTHGSNMLSFLLIQQRLSCLKFTLQFLNIHKFLILSRLTSFMSFTNGSRFPLNPREHVTRVINQINSQQFKVINHLNQLISLTIPFCRYIFRWYETSL